MFQPHSRVEVAVGFAKSQKGNDDRHVDLDGIFGEAYALALICRVCQIKRSALASVIGADTSRF